MNKIYLPFNEKDNINYILLLQLYRAAEYNEQTKTFCSIKYNSIQQLAETLSAAGGFKNSKSTIQRILNNKMYALYFSFDKNTKTITLNNNFKKDNTERKNKFVVLSAAEVNFLIEKNENLLCRYYLYQKYYCGYNKEKRHNSTEKQMLAAFGLSTKANNYISKLS